MISILPDSNYQNCEMIKTKYGDNVFVLTAKDGDECLGYGAVALYEDRADIVDVITAEGMESLEHGIFKAVMSFVERRSIYDCYCSLDNPVMLKRLGFAKVGDDSNLHYVSLLGYFEKHC